MKRAKHIMNPFIIAVRDKVKIRHALEIMNKYLVNSLPVKKENKVIGMVSRQMADRAIFHQLDDSSVDEIMTHEFSIISPNEDLKKIEQMIMEDNLRFVLVGETADKLQGIITRMELFRQLYHLRAEEMQSKGARKAVSQDIRSRMKKQIPVHILKLLKTVSQTADKHGFKAYLVGGFVRDLLLNIENIDVDVVIEGDGIDFAQKLAHRLKAQVKSHQKFGTSVLIIPDGYKLDITTARTEYYEKPASLPIVQPSALRHDLFRRDFTINALAIKLSQTEFGELLDFFGGLRDLRQGLIRVLHSLSFIEDPTRAFRAVRFQNRLGFCIETHTLKLMSIAIKKGAFQSLSGSRLLNELKLIIEEQNASALIGSLDKLGLLKAIFPQLALNKNIQNILLSMDSVVSWYKQHSERKKPQNWLLYLMAIIEGLSQKEKANLCQRLSITGNPQKIVLIYKEQTEHFLSQLALNRFLQPSDIYQLLHSYPLEMLLYGMVWERRKKVKNKISQYLTEFAKVRLKITGAELINMGLKPGPAVGQILKQLHSAKLNGLVKNKKDEIAYARSLID